MSDIANILFLAAEADPFVKIGGLADVAGSLPVALRALTDQDDSGVTMDVRLVLPLHRSILDLAETMHPLAEVMVTRGGESVPAKVFETVLNGMPVYFISGSPISDSPSVYSSDQALDQKKYIFFSLAALELIKALCWQPDIIHANDWHTALALYVLHSRQQVPLHARVHTVLTLHNLPYMGGDSADVLTAYGIKPLGDSSLPTWSQTQPLPLGLWSADVIVPVSPSYAGEILTPDYGCGLDSYLNGRIGSITGILNGLDVNFWDPATDKALTVCYSEKDISARSVNKNAIQKTLELKEDRHVPLLAMVGRMDWQKGPDITFDTLRQMAGRDWQFVILGSGDKSLEEFARQFQIEFPERVRAVIRYDERLGHLLYGGADMFLMPSRYEPCGLAQMIAMRYGCVPVVRATGGLQDTVHEGTTGFLFKKEEPAAMQDSLERALKVYDDPNLWQVIQREGMRQDFSWPRSARKYAQIYNSLIRS